MSSALILLLYALSSIKALTLCIEQLTHRKHGYAQAVLGRALLLGIARSAWLS
jgi:hypothetical protein